MLSSKKNRTLTRTTFAGNYIKCKKWWSHDFSPVVRTLTRRKRKGDKITLLIFRLFLFDLIKFDIFQFGRQSLFHFQNDNFVHHCELS